MQPWASESKTVQPQSSLRRGTEEGKTVQGWWSCTAVKRWHWAPGGVQSTQEIPITNVLAYQRQELIRKGRGCLRPWRYICGKEPLIELYLGVLIQSYLVLQWGILSLLACDYKYGNIYFNTQMIMILSFCLSSSKFNFAPQEPPPMLYPDC